MAPTGNSASQNETKTVTGDNYNILNETVFDGYNSSLCANNSSTEVGGSRNIDNTLGIIAFGDSDSFSSTKAKVVRPTSSQQSSRHSEIDDLDVAMAADSTFPGVSQILATNGISSCFLNFKDSSYLFIGNFELA